MIFTRLTSFSIKTQFNVHLLTYYLYYLFYLSVQSNPAIRTPALYGPLVITDTFLRPWESPALNFPLIHPLNTDTS